MSHYVLFESDGEPYTPRLYPSAVFSSAYRAKEYAASTVEVPVKWIPQAIGAALVGKSGSATLFEIYDLPQNPEPKGDDDEQ